MLGIFGLTFLAYLVLTVLYVERELQADDHAAELHPLNVGDQNLLQDKFKERHRRKFEKRTVSPTGQPSIFLSVASYRDKECGHTLHSALANATYPERLFFGIVQQNKPDSGDVDCLETLCTDQPDHCPRDRVRVKRMKHTDAQGPTVARALAEELLKDEDFILQVDSHMDFDKAWDETLMRQWLLLENDKAVLTVYPMPGNWRDEMQIPHICQAEFDGGGNQGFPHFRSYTHHPPNKPRLEPFWAAGFAFMRSHAVRAFPYDIRTPWVFHGEELFRGVGLWTHGYDFYSPMTNFIFHHYYREGAPKFFELGGGGEAERSARRIKYLLGMPFNGDYNKEQLDRNRMGKERNFWTFVEWAGIDWEARKGKMRCDHELPYVKPWSTLRPKEGEQHPIKAGVYKIKSLGVGKTLHSDCNNDKKVSTRFQSDDDYSKYDVQPQDDGTYRFKVKADGSYWHLPGADDQILTVANPPGIPVVPGNDYGRFIVKKGPIDGSYFIILKADGKSLHANQGQDEFVSTRFQTTDKYSLFSFGRIV